ncbi:MAG: hypothetical protein V3V96_06645 [Acidiferrobacterales bacterium]
MSINLKPCPFCGGPALNVAFDYITCGNAARPRCIGHLIRADIAGWNMRVPDLEVYLEKLETANDN